MTAAIVYRHTPDMGEISGFGGGYEGACQDMLEAGVKWLNEKIQPIDSRSMVDESYNGDAPVLKTHTYKGVYGIFVVDSEDGKALEKAVLAAVPDCSGAMHHAVMSRLMFIADNGWDAYCTKIREYRAEQAAKGEE